MRKLRLESLQVESFETTPRLREVRGTVAAHIPGIPSTTAPVYTYDARQCGPTNYFDCTFGCSMDTRCFPCYEEEASRGCEVK